MTVDDINWITEASKSYTYSETDRLQYISKLIGNTNLTDDEFVNLLTEL
jgi:hypothetical protein